jgi:hypothetical protein
MSKEEYIAILDSSFANGTPFINYTEFYSYALIPQADGKWLEISYDFEEKSVDKRELVGSKALMNLWEEIEKGLSEAIDDFQLFKWKEYKKTIPGSDDDKVKGSIKELTANGAAYSKNLPVVSKKEDLDKVKAKL